MTRRPVPIYLYLALSLFSCTTASPPLPPEGLAVRSIELFLARTAWQKTEFEQYKLVGDKLFYECGKITRGRYLPAEGKIAVLSGAPSHEVTQAAWRLLTSVNESDRPFDEPGSNRSLFDPGQFDLQVNLTVGETRVKTSLDSIANHKARSELRAYELATQLRRVVNSPPCGNRSFFGIGRNQNS